MPHRSSLVPFPVGTQIGTLTIDPNGDIFGTTISGGANDDGTVFEIEKTRLWLRQQPDHPGKLLRRRRTTVP